MHKKTNACSLPRDSRVRRLARYLRERVAGPSRTLYKQMLRGAAYSAGSGAVSLLIVWWQNRN